MSHEQAANDFEDELVVLERVEQESRHLMEIEGKVDTLMERIRRLTSRGVPDAATQVLLGGLVHEIARVKQVLKHSRGTRGTRDPPTQVKQAKHLAWLKSHVVL